MPARPSFPRRICRLAAAALAVGVLLSCAGKKEKISSPPPAAAAGSKKEPAPSPLPTPAPTPQARYTATATVDGVPVVQNQVLAPDGQAASGQTPSASPTLAATPAPTPVPKAAPANLFLGAWQKIFPSKPAPALTPGETGGVKIRVSTSEGGETEQTVRESAGTGVADAVPSPTPISIKLRPSEGFLTRMWHKVFPKKQEPPAAAPPQWVGTIKLINERDGYALIDSPASFAAPVGETLNSVGSDAESGVLRVTADRNAPFFIADIVSGKPRAGDRVYSPKP